MDKTNIKIEPIHAVSYVAAVEEQKKKLQDLLLTSSCIDSQPTIQIIPGSISETTTQAEELLTNNKVGIFQRAGQLVRIISETIKPKSNPDIKRPQDALIITSVDALYLGEALSRLAKWEQYDQRRNVWKQKDCPDKVAKTLLARREWNLPVLAGIIQAPILLCILQECIFQ